MVAKSTFPGYNLACDGNLAKLILDYREQGLSWQRISMRLFADHRVEIDMNTVQKWHQQILDGTLP